MNESESESVLLGPSSNSHREFQMGFGPVVRRVNYGLLPGFGSCREIVKFPVLAAENPWA